MQTEIRKTKKPRLHVVIIFRARRLGMAVAVLRIVQLDGGLLALAGFLLLGSQCPSANLGDGAEDFVNAFLSR